MSDVSRLTDEEVAAFVAERNASNGALVRMRAPEGASAAALVVQNMTSLVDPRDVALLADGVEDGTSRGTDAGGYAVRGDTVEVWDAGEERASMSLTAFTDLLDRLVGALAPDDSSR